MHGSSGGGVYTVTLETGEFITRVNGYLFGYFPMESFQFVTNLRTYGYYGRTTGTPFSVNKPGCQLGYAAGTINGPISSAEFHFICPP